MKTLTKQGAIERIREIRKDKEVDHLTAYKDEAEYYMRKGAEFELKIIFDIKESEL